MELTELVDVVNDLSGPFFARGESEVYLTVHCNRVFVGVFPPRTCRVCGNKPTAVRINKDTDLLSLLRTHEDISPSR